MTGMAPKYANGQLPLSALSSIGDGLYLEANAAAAWIQAKRAVFLELGIAPFISKPDGAYRDLAGQRRQKAAAIADGVPNRAATPGTSTHGTGVSLDINNIWQYNNARLDPIMARFGFRRNIPYESWHYTHDGSGTSAPSGGIGEQIGDEEVVDQAQEDRIVQRTANLIFEMVWGRNIPRGDGSGTDPFSAVVESIANRTDATVKKVDKLSADLDYINQGATNPASLVNIRKAIKP